MRVGLNLLYLRPGVSGGTETYAAGLLAGFAAIAHKCQFVVFLPREQARWPLPDRLRATRVVCGVSAGTRIARHIYEQTVLPWLLYKHGIHLIHSLGYTGPVATRCPSVVTIHDANIAAFGHTMGALERWSRTVLPFLSAHSADMVVTISAFSREQIVRTFRVRAEKVEAIYLGGCLDEVEEAASDEGVLHHTRLALPSRFLIAFSARSQHKNIRALVDVFRRLRRAGRLQQDLVLLGPPISDLASLGEPGIHWLGYVPRKTLVFALERAEWLVFPSTYEGFGLPVLEAMSRGIPVLCSRAGSLPEVAGKAAVYFDPWSEAEMEAVIGASAADPRLRALMAEAARARAKDFSWEETARRTLGVYASVLGGDDGSRSRYGAGAI